MLRTAITRHSAEKTLNHASCVFTVWAWIQFVQVLLTVMSTQNTSFTYSFPRPSSCTLSPHIVLKENVKQIKVVFVLVTLYAGICTAFSLGAHKGCVIRNLEPCWNLGLRQNHQIDPWPWARHLISWYFD